MLSFEFQCVFWHTVTWTNHISGAQLHVWPVAVGQHGSELHQALTGEPDGLPAPLGTRKRTEINAAPRLGCVSLVKAPVTGAAHSLAAALCSSSCQVPCSPVTSCCVCLSRAMMCSQRNTSLSQSPRVGFLSSLLPQSKKSPSRLSPAQGPPQAPSSARKEPISSQVRAKPRLSHSCL